MLLASSNSTRNNKNTSDKRIVKCFISACRKLTSFESVYAGLLVLFVPSVLSQAGEKKILPIYSLLVK